MPTTEAVRWLDADEQRHWRAWLMAGARVASLLDRDLHAAGLNHAYYEILVRLSEAPERTLRMSELAERSAVSRSRLSHAVSRLEADGLVARRMCPQDRRGQLATLTDAGFAALDAAAPGHVAAVRRLLLDGLTAAQLTELGEASAALNRHLDALGED